LPVIRVGGSAVSWFLFALNMSLLFYSATAVMSIGGSCASGGPYEISVQCPDSVVAFTPLSVFGGLAAVGVAMVFAQGFGVPLIVWAWPILFGSLGLAFVSTRDSIGYIIGGLFLVMAVVPLILEARGSLQRTVLGVVNSAGVRFAEPVNARRSMMTPDPPNPDGAVAPTGANWTASLGIFVLAALLGLWLARVWFFGS
jgi:hypothetical protein